MYMNSSHQVEEAQEGSDQAGHPILVMNDHLTNMTFSSVVPQKGVHAYSVVRVSNDISLLGHTELVLKSDNEASINALKDAVKAEASQKIQLSWRAGVRAARIVPEESAAYDSQSNGRVEGAIRHVQGKVRTLKDALESRYNKEIAQGHASLPWLIRHASWLKNRFVVGSDGKRHTKDGKEESSRRTWLSLASASCS